MPYIKEEQRKELIPSIEGVINSIKAIENWKDTLGGIINFTFTYILKSFTEENICYKKLAELLSALECAKLEFYRKMIAPYEDVKEEENGTV